VGQMLGKRLEPNRIVDGILPGNAESAFDEHTADRGIHVLVGSPTYRGGAYALDRFLENQREIQRRFPNSELILATAEHDFAPELESLLASRGIMGRVVLYEVVKPPYARRIIWNVACGRESIRRYMLSQTDADYLLSLDHDMVCDPNIIRILLGEIQGYDVVHSGHRLRWSDHAIGMGAGCALISRRALEKVAFRCFEFKNGDIMDDGLTLELDLIRSGCRVKKGVFLRIDHYIDAERVRSIEPQPLGLLRRLSTSWPFRYAILRLSLLLRRDISSRLHIALLGLLGFKRGIRRVRIGTRRGD